MPSIRAVVLSCLPHSVSSRLRILKSSLTSPNWIDETEIIARLSPLSTESSPLILVDVGAHFGNVTKNFLNRGWSVVAYEPDPANRDEFNRLVGTHPRVEISAAAASDKATKSAYWYTSPVSTGISTLAAFHDSHQPTANVDVVTLSEDLRHRGVQSVDFLKIDTEGFDYFALKGFDWSYSPRFVVYEFEDRKTIPLGYSLADSTAYVAARGYHLVYSVWEPIIEYGQRHRWRGLFTTAPSDIGSCWGNVLCFRDETDLERCLQKFSSRATRLLDELRLGKTRSGTLP